MPYPNALSYANARASAYALSYALCLCAIVSFMPSHMPSSLWFTITGTRHTAFALRVRRPKRLNLTASEEMALFLNWNTDQLTPCYCTTNQQIVLFQNWNAYQLTQWNWTGNQQIVLFLNWNAGQSTAQLHRQSTDGTFLKLHLEKNMFKKNMYLNAT